MNFTITPYIEERTDGKFHVVVTTLIDKDWCYDKENVSIASFDTFLEAGKYAKDYYNKQVKGNQCE
tara:strand:- start:30362 stop:30559 length:198 start_codon:yes stop_codon:yes gene_type:complete